MALHRIADIEAALLREVLVRLSDDLSIRPSIIISHHFPKKCDMLVTDLRVFLDCIQPLVVHATQQSAGGVVAVTLTVDDHYQSLTVDIYHSRLDTAGPHCETLADVHGKDDLTTAESALGLTIACKAAALLDGEVSVLSPKHEVGSHARVVFNNPVCASSISPPCTIKQGQGLVPQKFYRFASTSAVPSLGHYFSRWLSNTGWLESKEKSESLVVVDYKSDLAQFYQQLASVSTEQVVICLVPEHATFPDFENERVRRQDNAVYIQGPFLTEQLLQAMELVATILVEAQQSIAEVRECSFPEVVDAPNLLATVQNTIGCAAKSGKRSPRFPKQTQKQLAESLQSLTIGSEPSLLATKLGTDLKKPWTLLVDDNTVNLRLLEMYCERRGFPYRTATDGRQAVKIFSEAVVTKYNALLQKDVPTQVFDLILMDLQMPECDGIDATRQIRQMEDDNGWEKSVLFIITGQDSPNDRKNAEEAGADEFLTKPLGPKVLDQWVKKWCPEAGI